MTVHRLDNVVQNYAWGHRTALAQMQGREPAGEPEAELWVGAHPSAPSTVVRRDGADVTLRDFLTGDGGSFLPEGAQELPFLLKILAIGGPLSIQVHPDPAQAREGYAAAEAQGVPVSDPTRSYKDPHAKPEVVVALEPMRVLVGLLDAAARHSLVESGHVDWLRPLVDASPAEFVTAVFDLDEQATARALADLAEADLPDDRAALVRELLAEYPGDRGVLVASCMNLVHLEPGQALFTDAGVLHAYVDGLAVEIMNPSDNVLRAGLTRKHVDVAELARILREEQGEVSPLHIEKLPEGGERIPLWTEQVGLRRYSGAHDAVELRGLTIALATSGTVTLTVEGEDHQIAAGHALLVLGDHRISLTGGDVYLADCA